MNFVNPIRILLLLLLISSLSGCGVPLPILEQIKKDGVLRVATFSMPTTVYKAQDGKLKGFEHDLVHLFAKRLGVKVEYVFVDKMSDMLPLVKSQKVHFAAGGIIITPERQTEFKFGPSYLAVNQQVIFRMGEGNRSPKDIEDFDGKILEVSAGSSQESLLQKLKQSHSKLDWNSNKKLSPDQLLRLVNDKLIDYSITTSNHFAVVRRYYPQLASAFDIGEKQRLAWAFPHSNDESLYDEMLEFFITIKVSDQLDQLIERYYGHIERLKYVDLITFMRHYQQRLPTFQQTFYCAAGRTNIPWQLLAAVAYQESHWNPHAVSPTGVKGLMMLTLGTAKDLGVEDRTNPIESILGGATYLADLKELVADHITEPDRTWFALAGYNVGFGHVDDARILAEKAGENPDKWLVVKKFLPLLSKRQWYSKTKYGQARGQEPVTYVDNIRGYYDLLLAIEEEQQLLKKEQQSTKKTIKTPAAL